MAHCAVPDIRGRSRADGSEADLHHHLHAGNTHDLSAIGKREPSVDATGRAGAPTGAEQRFLVPDIRALTGRTPLRLPDAPPAPRAKLGLP